MVIAWRSCEDLSWGLALAESLGDVEAAKTLRLVMDSVRVLPDGALVMTPTGLPLGVRITKDGEAGVASAGCFVLDLRQGETDVRFRWAKDNEGEE